MKAAIQEPVSSQLFGVVLFEAYPSTIRIESLVNGKVLAKMTKFRETIVYIRENLPIAHKLIILPSNYMMCIINRNRFLYIVAANISWELSWYHTVSVSVPFICNAPCKYKMPNHASCELQMGLFIDAVYCISSNRVEVVYLFICISNFHQQIITDHQLPSSKWCCQIFSCF